MKNREKAVIDRLKKQIYLKKIKGKEYVYIREKNSFFSREYYVCRFSSDVNLDEALHHTAAKMGYDLIYEIISAQKKYHKSKYIQDDSFIMMEMVRLGYLLWLKEYEDSEINQYEEKAFTKYVYGTTNIEGNTYTLRETDLTLNEGVTVEGKKKREFYEVENYSKLKEFLDIKKNVEINEPLILELHKIIMKNIDDVYAGEYRRVAVGVRGATFQPVPHIFIEKCLSDLIVWYNKNKDTMYPVELAAIFHQRFEEIHPFVDGNGRVGRELMRIILKNSGFPSIFIGPSHRSRYLKGLDAGNDKDYSKIVSFLIDNITETNSALMEKAQSDFSKKTEGVELDKKKQRIIKKFEDKMNKIKMDFNEEDYVFNDF